MHSDILFLREMVSVKKHFIRWAGRCPSGLFYVVLQSPGGQALRYECDPSRWNMEGGAEDRLTFKEADEGSATTADCSPPDSTVFSLSRRAAVFGVNLGGDCMEGACKKYSPVGLCTLAYDIETEMDRSRRGGFALYDSKILSVAARCSCGEEFYTCSKGQKGPPQMVSEFVGYVLEHAPLWTVGWNCYNFDNECMRFHCSSELKDLFMVVRTGAFGKPTYGSIINIPGTYNVDMQLYMVKSLYSLPSFKLGDVAESLGVTRKMKMPSMSGDVDETALRAYNLNDCVVTLDIWRKEGIENIIPSLAVCTSSPVYDCCRYVTGTLASLGYSSYAAARGHLVEWGLCSLPQSYAGGYVMEPTRGLHLDIVVCDFKSMYPSIMASCNINPHSFSLRSSSKGARSGDVSIGKHTTEVCTGGTTAVFDSRRPSVMSLFMGHLIRERESCKKSLPMYAKSLKVLSNSVYGSLGYSNSHLYSPTCAAGVTAVGRHCVKLARGFFSREGLSVIYGDTDSCMVTGGSFGTETREKTERALGKLHSYMEKTSLSMMRMEIEECYPKGLMTDKKRYCMLLADGSMKKVGISLSRKDASGLCREAAESTIRALFMESRKQTLSSISGFVSTVSCLAVEGNLTLSDVSRYVKKDGMSCYCYPGRGGETRYVAEDEAELQSVVRCDVGKVLRSVAVEIERFTVPCMLGSVSDIMRASSFGMT